jgi:hypothetical protein
MRKISVFAILCVLMLTSGCASIVSGQNQPLSVETRNKGASLSGASCRMTNDKGEWLVTTPGSATVRRSADDLSIRCEKEPFNPGFTMIKSSVKGMAFGNILFGGGVGAGVDYATGAAFDYPTSILVEMGESQKIANPEPQRVVAPEPQRQVSQPEVQNVSNPKPQEVALPTPAITAHTEIEQTVRAWAQAWSSRNMDGYLAFYSDNSFVSEKFPNRSSWKTNRYKALTSANAIRVTLADIKIAIFDANHAQVTFMQDYWSNNYQDQGRKTLSLQKEGGVWKITQERG